MPFVVVFGEPPALGLAARLERVTQPLRPRMEE